MRLLRTDVDELILEEVFDEYEWDRTKYAILSHTWLADDQEIKFADLHLPLEELKAREGWAKVEGSKRQALRDGLHYVWIDTLCIDKSSSTELAEAINSMFRWYKKSQVCYVYLQDMPDPYLDDGLPGWLEERRAAHALDHQGPDLLSKTYSVRPSMPTDSLPRGTATCDANSVSPHENYLLLADHSLLDLVAFRTCRWFKRGWTLQELLAPAEVQFFSISWTRIQHSELLREVSRITQIHAEALFKQRDIETYSIAQRMSWAAHRETKRIEDRAYSLLGLFNINMGIVYGEGRRAFRRLQEELLRESFDQTIFAFRNLSGTLVEQGSVVAKSPCELLAKSPGDFAHSSEIESADLYYGGRFQLTGPTINFQAPTINPNAHADLRSEGIVLSCRLTSDPSMYVVLNVRRQEHADGSSTHWISDDRISLIDAHVLHSHQRLKSQSITIPMTLTPLLVHGSSVPVETHYHEISKSLICRFRRRGPSADFLSLYQIRGWTFADAVPLSLWNEVNSSFGLCSSANGRYEASIQIRSRSGEQVGRLQIQGHNFSSMPRFRVRFEGGFFSLPWWCAHGRSMKWNRGKPVIYARSLYIRTLKGDVPMVEVGHTTPSGAVIDTMISIITWLAALALSQGIGFLKGLCISLVSMAIIRLAIPPEKRTNPSNPLGIEFLVSMSIANFAFDRIFKRLRAFKDLDSWFWAPLDYYIPQKRTPQYYLRRLRQKHSGSSRNS